MQSRFRLPAAAAAVMLSLACGGAAAQNWIGLMKNSPAERFNEDDLQLFIETGRKVLSDETPQGQTLSWENPKTRARGDMTVVKIYTMKEMPCRQVRLHNEADGRKGNSLLSLCRDATGKWRAVSAPQAVKP